MDIANLTPDYAVSPQIAPADIDAIKAAGFTTVICNRPDPEVPPDLRADTVKAAVEAAGLTFVDNPVEGGTIGIDAVPGQQAALAAADGPVLAYCRSGTRSAIVWAIAQANGGAMPVPDILAKAQAAGYDLSGLAPVLEQAAAAR